MSRGNYRETAKHFNFQLIIFRDKTNKTIKNIETPNGFVIVTQEKAWMDESLIKYGLIKYGNHMQKKNKRNWISTNRYWYMMPSKHT